MDFPIRVWDEKKFIKIVLRAKKNHQNRTPESGPKKNRLKRKKNDLSSKKKMKKFEFDSCSRKLICVPED